MQNFDFLVIGGGSGGVRAARLAAQAGASVALVEAGKLGGTCVNLGCIPKKLYSHAAHFGTDFNDAAGFGWQLATAPRFDWNTLKTGRRQEISRLNAVYQQRLEEAGVKIINGFARLLDGNTVQVDAEKFHARYILLATGGTPHVPQLPGREHVLTSNDMFDLTPFPARLAVVGGGYIACEMASIFNGLGANVTQLYRGKQILRGFDDDMRNFLAGELGKHGVDLRLECDVKSIERQGQGLQLTLSDGASLQADAVLYATGRAPNVAGLGLPDAGVRQNEDGAIIVDAQYQSSLASVYAIGDVTARKQLTPVALAEAAVVVDHLFGKGERKIDYEFVPSAVFTQPNLATVGYDEARAREKFGAVTVYQTEFMALKHRLSGSNERTLMKLIVAPDSGRVIGLHMVGAEASEIVQGFAVAIQAGATKAMFDNTIGIHPSAAEEFVTLRQARS